MNKIWQLFFLPLVVLYYFVDKSLLLSIYFALAILLLGSDYLSRFNVKFGQIVQKIINFDNKSNKISPLAYFIAGSLLVLLFFSQQNALNAILITILCPIIASLAEKNFQIRDFFEKNLSFVIGFLASGVIILIANNLILGLNLSYFFFALISLIATTIIACRPSFIDINHNFLLIIAFALTNGCFGLIWQI